MCRSQAFGSLATAALSLLLLTGLVGCDADGLGEYAVWPVSARTGDTIAILFNTEYDTGFTPEGALLDANVGNVDIQITDSLGHTEFVVPRAVIEVPAALGSLAVGADLESLTGLVAVFDLPDPWPNGAISFPNAFTLVVQYAGAATFGGNNLEVLGEGGTPLSLAAATPLSALEAQPMLRLRPAWDPVASEGFDPNWTIGGIEFTLRYMASTAGDIDQLTVVSNGEATSGLAMANPLAPEGSDKLWKVMLLHPDGFDLPDKGCDGTGRCFAGRWSLVDLAFQKDITGVPSATPVFVASDFSIEDLRVVDLGGVQLNPPYWGEQFFHGYVTNNLALFVTGPDADEDGVGDASDNCTQVFNPDQFDADFDGFGNACDADINNDGGVGLDDVSAILTAAKSGLYSPVADINNDGGVGLDDVSKAMSANGEAPGPSGLACAGTGVVPCTAF